MRFHNFLPRVRHLRNVDSTLLSHSREELVGGLWGMAAECRVLVHSVAGRQNGEGQILDPGIRCVFVVDGINLDVPVAYVYLDSSDGLSSVS